MDFQKSELPSFRGQDPRARRGVLQNHQIELARINEIQRLYQEQDVLIIAGLLADERDAIEHLEELGLPEQDLIVAYQAVAQEYQDTHATEYIDALLEQQARLVPGTPFISEINSKLRVVTHYPHSPIVELGSVTDTGVRQLVIRVATTHQDDVFVSAHSEIGFDAILIRLDGMYKRNSIDLSYKDIEKAIKRYELVGALDRVEVFRALLVRRRAETVDL